MRCRNAFAAHDPVQITQAQYDRMRAFGQAEIRTHLVRLPVENLIVFICILYTVFTNAVT